MPNIIIIIGTLLQEAIMMSYDVTGGGPREAGIVYLSIPVLILLYFKRYELKCEKKDPVSLVGALNSFILVRCKRCRDFT